MLLMTLLSRTAASEVKIKNVNAECLLSTDVWNANRNKSFENQKVSCIIENIGFAIKICAVLCYLLVKNCVRLTNGEVNILAEN